MYLLGYDCGTSSIKASLLEASTGRCIASASSPDTEMPILSTQSGWAEQDPALWWHHLIVATQQLKSRFPFQPADVKAIGISYQMHGLVCVDKKGRILRPAIIWCDSRAVVIGQCAAEKLGPQRCLQQLLNLPGNFTASKLAWVKENEPDIFNQIYQIMLPGDWIAYQMTEKITTTASGLSEMMLWDFQNNARAEFVLDHFGICPSILPPIVPTFDIQGTLTSRAADALGLADGIPVAYRAGDQPNNALSLKVLEPGEVAATAGTSGVIYGVSDRNHYDNKSRVNVFLHVNHTPQAPRNGILLCINGTGRLNSWLKHQLTGMDYEVMNGRAARIPVGAEGLTVLPYGNGAERTLENQNIGAVIAGLDFNIHRLDHILRAGQEGIVFAMIYGLDIMRQMGVNPRAIRAGKANMFLSPLFASAFATLANCVVELYNTDGAQGAARGAGIGAGVYKNVAAAFEGLEKIQTIEPNCSDRNAYIQAYGAWKEILKKFITSLNC